MAFDSMNDLASVKATTDSSRGTGSKNILRVFFSASLVEFDKFWHVLILLLINCHLLFGRLVSDMGWWWAATLLVCFSKSFFFLLGGTYECLSWTSHLTVSLTLKWMKNSSMTSHNKLRKQQICKMAAASLPPELPNVITILKWIYYNLLSLDSLAGCALQSSWVSLIMRDYVLSLCRADHNSVCVWRSLYFIHRSLR